MGSQSPLSIFFLIVHTLYGINNLIIKAIEVITMRFESEPRRQRIDIRTTLTAKQTLQDAAALSSKTITEFLLDSALTKAAEVLADRRVFSLDDEKWELFMAALDAPTRDMPNLKKLLQEPSVLEKESTI
jgi:uncharacterized protein (DUF1778 family)